LTHWERVIVLKVLYVISEAAPFLTTGGLGEAGGSLPAALSSQGAEICVMLPMYSAIDPELLEGKEYLFDISVNVSWRTVGCCIESLKYNGVQYYFVNCDYYFNREGVYGHFDEAERFSFFCRAVLDCLPRLGFKPDVIHCHDWQSALIPILLNNGYQHDPFYYDVKTVFTVHNIKYQGVFSSAIVEDVCGLESTPELWERLEFFGAVNLVKAAIYYANKVTTVSPSYVLEIQDPYFGENLDGVLRANSYKLSGILNGIDTQKYDPQRDPYIFVPYRSSQLKKAENKAKLQAQLGLPAGGDSASPGEGFFNERVPMLASIGRLVDQKGLDLFRGVFDEIMSMDLQLVVLGSGDYIYEDFLREMAHRYPHKLAIYIGYDVQLAHRIYAAADMLLMPSRFEPCGVAQMIGMRYGTIPIVRETGGLKDTVQPYNEVTGEGNGFSFANYNAHEFLETIQRAVNVYRYEEVAWKGLFENARKSKFDWKDSAAKYMVLFKELVQ